MTLRQLTYFLKVVETGSMTRAAERLHVAQPALGTQIRQLEEELGVALLLRHARGIEPTAAGSLLEERARAILDLVERTRRDVTASGRDVAEPVRLGLTPSLMHIIGTEIALQARERAPLVSLSLSEEMSHLLVDALLRGEIDMALAYEVPDLPQVARRALYQEDLVLVGLPGPLSGEPVTFAEVLAYDLVLPEPRDSVRALVARTARELGLELTVAHEIRSIAGIKSLILRGAAAGILPYGTVLAEARDGSLGVRPIVAPTLRRTLYLATAGARGRPASELALVGVVHAALRSLAHAMGPLGHPLLPSEE